jgi:uncharacterized protein YqhQ
MSHRFPLGIRVGGSALPDGVMMLTPLAAAYAREAPGGGFTVESDTLPQRRPHRIEKVPFLRILPKLFSQMALVVRGWRRRRGAGIPIPLIAVAITVGVVSTGINLSLTRMPVFWHALISSILQLALLFAFIATTRLFPQLGRIWRFHGGEHQAIAAYEAEMDLTVANARTRSLYHPRCGTNLASLSLLLMVPGMVAGSTVSGLLGYLITLAIPLPALCIAFEIVMLGQKRVPVVRWPGLALQRLTVAAPGDSESQAGILALKAALAQHEKIEARLAVTSGLADELVNVDGGGRPEHDQRHDDGGTLARAG